MAMPLTSDDLVIVFAQSIAGLGHLRVSDALYHGLPEGAHAVLLGTKDKNITAIHNLTSQNLTLRHVVEFFEAGPAQDVFAAVYTRWLRANTANLRLQLQTILDRHPHLPKTVLVVATHFGLAHQLAQIKKDFARQNNIRLVLVVVVTDDAPFHVWAVPGADFIIVPSDHTKWALERYHRAMHFGQTKYMVLPYMVSPLLARPLGPEKSSVRREQLDPKSGKIIHVAVPIAGAAVQLDYLTHLMRALAKFSGRFRFHVVAKRTKKTEKFLWSVSNYKNVELITSSHDRETVDLYEKLYQEEVISLEITKPSEQAFKALISPKQVGGPILLFSDPVGVQEWDNLAFLERHGMIPKNASKMRAWTFSDPTVTFSARELSDARRWRGLRLPVDAQGSASFIVWSLSSGVLAAMADFAGYEVNPGIADDGVARFWKMIGESIAEG